MRALVIEGESLMQDARKLMETLKLAAAISTEALGKLDVRIICFLTKKGKESEGKVFESIPAVAEVACKN